MERSSSSDSPTVNRTSSAFQASSIVTSTAVAAATNPCPWATTIPSNSVTSSATDVVISSVRSTSRLRMFSRLTSAMAPPSNRNAATGWISHPRHPARATSAKVRSPTSLWAHSRSSPINNPIPRAIPTGSSHIRYPSIPPPLYLFAIGPKGNGQSLRVCGTQAGRPPWQPPSLQDHSESRR
jgi:hypothetical protein